MFQEQRHSMIKDFLKRNKAVKASELVEILGVSIDTVRRDLESLEKAGIVKRVHGGAILKHSNDNVLNKLFNEREIKNQQKKQELAITAVDLIEEGQTIALNGGTTTIEVAKVIAERFQRLTIITNDLRIVTILSSNKKFNIILTGGFFDPEEYTLYGRQCEEMLANFNIDLAFITANGLSCQEGLTDFRLNEIGVIKTILARSKFKVLVADSTKFETASYMNICSIHDIDLIVTDSSLPTHVLNKYTQEGIRILEAAPAK